MDEEKQSTKQRVREEKAKKEEEILKIATDAMANVVNLNGDGYDVLNVMSWIEAIGINMILTNANQQGDAITLAQLMNDINIEATAKYNYMRKVAMQNKAKEESEKKDDTSDS